MIYLELSLRSRARSDGWRGRRAGPRAAGAGAAGAGGPAGLGGPGPSIARGALVSVSSLGRRYFSAAESSCWVQVKIGSDTPC